MTSARRARSRDTVLEAVRAGAGATRRDVERATGLSRGAVADAVADLLARGLVAAGPPVATPGSRGRPSAVLVASRPAGFVLGLDFGHTHVAAALADTSGTVVSERRQVVDVDTRSQRALDAAAGLVDDLLAGLDRSAVRAAVAGIPGPVDSASKLVRSPTILADWVGVDAEAELADRLGIPVTAGNDADMGAVGEGALGAARGLRDYLYVKVSHGIGAGLVLGGAVYRGAGGLVGEIGHTQVADVGGWCRCGNRGCLESVVSVAEIERQLDSLDAAAAARILHEAGRTIGRVLADLCNCLNPAGVVVGGELAMHGEHLVAGVRESIHRFAQPATAAMAQVRTAELGLGSELIGAVTCAVREAGRPR